jgi:HupE / UreJ protein
MFHPDFKMWLNEGVHHILNIDALDHILFIIVLCITHSFQHWKKTLFLITAFTLGHSVTLAAVAFGWLNVNTRWVEFLIPLTMAFTAIQRIFRPSVGSSQPGKREWGFYILALFFGLIHGMAFGAAPIGSLYTRSEAIPLVLAFNLGIELAQLLVVTGLLLLSYLLTRLCKIPERYWQVLLSSCILVYALYLTVKHTPF